MSNMYQTTTLTSESVRFALVQQYIQMFQNIPDDRVLVRFEEIVKYIYQSK